MAIDFFFKTLKNNVGLIMVLNAHASVLIFNFSVNTL